MGSQDSDLLKAPLWPLKVSYSLRLGYLLVLSAEGGNDAVFIQGIPRLVPKAPARRKAMGRLWPVLHGPQSHLCPLSNNAPYQDIFFFSDPQSSNTKFEIAKYAIDV